MVPGTTRQLSLKLNGLPDSPDLTADPTLTQYKVSNPEVVSVSSDGLVRAIQSGTATITVSYGESEVEIPVLVAAPQTGAATLGVDGGVVQADSGATVAIAPGALDENTTVSLTSLRQEDLTLPVPEKFAFAGAFQLDVGSSSLQLPAQLAVPAPGDLAAGTEVFFMRQGSLPDATGSWNPIWLVEDSGVVGTDGMIRTASPPWPGVATGGTYTIAVPKFRYTIGQALFSSEELARAEFQFYAGAALITVGLGVATFSPAGLGIASVGAGLFTRSFYIPFFAETTTTVTPSLDVLAIPTVGRLPYRTTVGVELNPRGVPTASVDLKIPSLDDLDPFAPPILQQAELKLDSDEPLVYLTGSNFLNDSGELGSQFEDLIVNFRTGEQTKAGTVLPALCQKLDDNSYTVVVRPPQTVVLGESAIELVRPQHERLTLEASQQKVVEYESQEYIQLPPQDVELALVAKAFGDQVTVLNAKDPEAILETPGLTSRDLVLANIPVGTPELQDVPRELAVTSDATCAYVPLEQSGSVAIVDLMMLRSVDTNPETTAIEPINLRQNNLTAAPREIVLGPKDRYAYIADRQQGKIYVLDISPNSTTYNQLVQTINVSSAPSGLRQLAISSDGKKLFATTPNGGANGNGQIFVINIDLKDRPQDGPNSSNNPQKWHEQIGVVVAGKETEGIAATPNPNQMVFTNRGEDAKGFGVFTITSDDPLQFATAQPVYASLGLGSFQDYFDVNEGIAVTVTSDGKYAFVAGRNSKFLGQGIPSVDGPKAGSNVGIIKDPLGPTPRLVAATRPIPQGLTTDLALSGDDKYLYASYPGVGAVFGFDVEEMLNTVNNPNGGNLATTPIDDINSKVSIAADLKPLTTSGSQISYGVPASSNRGPLVVGNNPSGMARASHRDWIDVVDPGMTTTDLTPTLEWQFDPGFEDVSEINLFVSTFPQGKGLLPWDEVVNLSDDSFLSSLSLEQKRQLLTQPWNGYNDFNPGRILTATWKRNENGGGIWEWGNGYETTNNTPTSLTLGDERTLTGGQTYHWAVQAISSKGKTNIDFGQIRTQAPPSTSPFSSVSVLTHGFTLLPSGTGIPDTFFDLANEIVSVNGDNPSEKGLMMRYDKPTGAWIPIDKYCVRFVGS